MHWHKQRKWGLGKAPIVHFASAPQVFITIILSRGEQRKREEKKTENETLFSEARYNNGEYVFVFIPGPGRVIAPANS